MKCLTRVSALVRLRDALRSTDVKHSIVHNDQIIGSSILELVTAGMYGDPLVMYREYIQNSADAMTGTMQDGEAEVRISLDQTERKVRIRDNGPGISAVRAADVLVRVASSDKDQFDSRGFRGIGRLVGLAFAESVVFYTRHRHDERVTRVEWNRTALRSGCRMRASLADVLGDCVSVASEDGDGWPGSFFEVQISGITLQASSVLLNRDAVRNYIGAVCPVPVSDSFPFRESAYNVLREDPLMRELQIYIDGDDEPVSRCHRSIVSLSRSRNYEYLSFERVEIAALDGFSPAGVGWIAHWAYAGAIPESAGVRGIRARRGNIQVGGDDIFDHLFREARFNRWCVGELYILDPRIVPNARRDYFEHNPDLRNLENQLGAVLHQLSIRCRALSSARNRERRLADSVASIRSAYALAVSGFVNQSNGKAIARKALAALTAIRKAAESGSTVADGIVAECRLAESELRSIDWGKVDELNVGARGIERKAYQRVFAAVVECADSSTDALRLIRAVIKEIAD